MARYITVHEAATYIGCSEATVRKYLAIEDEKHSPFKDTIIITDGNVGRSPCGLNEDEVRAFAVWYAGKKRGDQYLSPDQIEAKPVLTFEDKIRMAIRVEHMRKEITDIGMRLMGLLGDLQELEKRL